MPDARLSMRKIREVLRLHTAPDRTQLLHRSKHRPPYINLAEAADLTWSVASEIDDSKLNQLLFDGRPEPPSRRAHPAPDFAAIHAELLSRKDLTLDLLWQEYHPQQSGGYRYSRFCDLYREWLGSRNLSLRQEHKPGDPLSGEAQPAPIFVALSTRLLLSDQLAPVLPLVFPRLSKLCALRPSAEERFTSRLPFNAAITHQTTHFALTEHCRL